MENSFVRAAKMDNAKSFTENGMECYNTTSSALVDLFGTIGALRSRNRTEVVEKFTKAFNENKLLATKMSFYARDIRNGGLGERNVPRMIWKHIARTNPEIMAKNAKWIPYFGRWDDIYCLMDTPCESIVWDMITNQLEQDICDMNNGKPISLMAKWLPSINTSSKETRNLGIQTAEKLFMSHREYRKTLSSLRAYIKVAETMMSANEWKNIDYSAVPSKAMNNYRNAFNRHDRLGFAVYLADVAAGNTKINSSTLFPYDIVEKYFNYYPLQTDIVLEEQWKALPNYVSSDDNVLVIADVSGSMCGRPMATSVGLAIYFAERTQGDFHNLFMTFSSDPEFVELEGNTLAAKIYNCKKADWGMSTNIEAAFTKVLEMATSHHIPAKDMPKAIVIISDMEFNEASYQKWDFYSEMKRRFNMAGYDIPNIVFWNVDSRHDTYHAFSDYEGVQLMSGQSASTFKAMLENIGKTPYEAMLDVLNSDAYDCIEI